MTKLRKFTVWSLDVWGHGPDECEEPCDVCGGAGLECQEEGRTEEPHDYQPKHDQCDGYQVNDRSRAGHFEMEVSGTKYNVGTPREFSSFEPDDDQIITALIAENFLREDAKDKVEVSDSSGDGVYYIEAVKDGMPIFQLESEEEEK